MIETLCFIAIGGCIWWHNAREKAARQAARRHYDFVCEVRALGEKR